MNSEPHIPYRTCIGCRQRKPKHELNRFVLENNRIILDKQQTQPGRGVYLCANWQCLNKALENKAFFRGFKTQFELDVQHIKTEFSACLN